MELAISGFSLCYIIATKFKIWRELTAVLDLC